MDVPMHNSAQRGLRSVRRRFELRRSQSAVQPSQEKKLASRAGNSHSNLLILILAIVATVLVYRACSKKYHHQLHAAVQKELVQLFADSQVNFESLSQNDRGDIVLSNVTAGSKSERKAGAAPTFAAGRVVLRGNLGIDDWLQKRIALSKVELFGIQCNVYPTADGSWSVEGLIPHPKPNSTPPKIIFAGATVNLRKSEHTDAPRITFHDLTGVVDHRKIVVASQTTKVIDANVTGRSSGTIGSFQFKAHVAPERNTWAVEGNIKRLMLAKSLHETLPPEISKYLAQLSGLECEAGAAFKVTSQDGNPPNFTVNGQLRSGRLQDERLPYLLQNIDSQFTCENSVLKLKNLSAESGAAKIKLNANIFGYRPKSPLVVAAQVANLELDHRLYESLSPKLQASWDKMNVTGGVTGDVHLTFDGRNWTPKIDVRLQNVAIRPWLFPYPIENIAGRVVYQNNQISSEHVSGLTGGQPMHGSFSLTNSRQAPESVSPWFGTLTCSVDKPVSIDELMLSSLTQTGKPMSGGEKFVRSLHPTGTVRVSSAVFHRSSLEDTWHKKLDALIESASIEYDLFRYPIYDIRGRLRCTDNEWTASEFVGHNDSGRIHCSGNWQIAPEGVPMHLDFRAENLPVDKELKTALPAETQFVWDEIRPQGTLDKVLVQLSRKTPNTAVRTEVRILEESSTNASSGTSLRVKPKSFPYLLSDVDCDISYIPGYVKIHHASGTNGDSRIAMGGECMPREDGRWRADVKWLPQTRLVVNRELLLALPASIRDSLVKTDFRGPISIFGKSQIVFADSEKNELETAWDAQLAIEDGQLADGSYVGNLRGTVWMQGENRGDYVEARGSLDMDALTVFEIPVTRLRGPFIIQDNQLYFGDRTEPLLTSSPALQRFGASLESTAMTASSLTGKFVLAGRSKMGTGEFEAETSLNGADLNLLLRDLSVDSASVEGLCDAQISIDGILWDPKTYHGDGKIQINEAKLYELPFMIRLMNVASVSAQDDAFQTANIDFEVDGERIELANVYCAGDVIRLKGEGSTNLRREINLDMYAYVGSRFPGNRVVSPLLQESRFATLMKIRVDGTLDNPTMKRRAFPQLEATMQQIFPELAERESSPILPWRR